MSPTPRDISPELVLVDPELASRARLQLTEPSWSSGRRVPPELERIARSSTLPPPRQRAAGTRGLGRTLLLKLAAGGLTLNGFLIAVALHSATPSAAPQT